MVGKKFESVLTAVLLIVVAAQFVPRSVAQSPSDLDHCKGVKCQQGTCQPEFLFHTCKCKDGWENVLGLSWAPCGIPKDCPINYTCNDDAKVSAPPPPPLPPPPPFSFLNLTALNPCSFSVPVSSRNFGVCGFGKCVAEDNPGFLTVPYSCACDPGNLNVMNVSSGICVPNCNLGLSCSNLGIPLSNSTTDQGSTISTPTNAGLYPPGAAPGGSVQPPSAGKRSKELATLLASATVGAALWLWI